MRNRKSKVQSARPRARAKCKPDNNGNQDWGREVAAVTKL
jgi:hypothetical protein